MAVEEDVAVGAEAEDVVGGVGAVVGVSEWSDVGALGVSAGWGFECGLADLASMVMDLFDPLSCCG